MRQNYGWMVGCALMVVLVGGCGSTGDSTDGNDALVVRLLSINGDGISQGDSVLPNSASVDVFQDKCVMTGAGQGVEIMFSDELFTQTTFNAVFQNDQKLDIKLNKMVLHFDNPAVGFGDITEAINGVVTGGRCSNASDRSCASDVDCVIGLTRGTCNFSETQISGLLLVDLQAKAAVQPQIYGQGIPAKITFYGSDVTQKSYQVTAGYTVTFDEFCNCETGELCCPTLEACGF